MFIDIRVSYTYFVLWDGCEPNNVAKLVANWARLIFR